MSATPEGWEPYADGTSGHQGDTSADAEPYRRFHIDVAHRMVARAGTRGITWKELGRELGLHHGQASGALSNLHRSDLIVRLIDRRERCGVYVLPMYANGRETVSHRSNKTRPPEAAERIEELVQQVTIRGIPHTGDQCKQCAGCALVKAARIVRGEE